jgi:hypothetical protein
MPECATAPKKVKLRDYPTVRGLASECVFRYTYSMCVQQLESWDKQMESAVVAGKSGHPARQADAPFEAGRCTPL